MIIINKILTGASFVVALCISSQVWGMDDGQKEIAASKESSQGEQLAIEFVLPHLDLQSLYSFSQVSKESGMKVVQELFRRLPEAAEKFSKALTGGRVIRGVEYSQDHLKSNLFLAPDLEFSGHIPNHLMCELEFESYIKIMLSLTIKFPEQSPLALQATQFILTNLLSKSKRSDFQDMENYFCIVTVDPKDYVPAEKLYDPSADSIGFNSFKSPFDRLISSAPFQRLYLKSSLTKYLVDHCASLLTENQLDELNDICHLSIVNLFLNKYPCTRDDVRTAANHLIQIQDYMYFCNSAYMKIIKFLIKKPESEFFTNCSYTYNLTIPEDCSRTFEQKKEDFDLLRQLFKHAQENLGLDNNLTDSMLSNLLPALKNDQQATLFKQRHLNRYFEG